MMSLQKETGMLGQGKSILLAIAVVILGGCASAVTGLQTDLGLSRLTFPFEKIAVGGVVAGGKTDAELEKHYSSLLYKRLMEKRRPLSVISADDVRNSLGVEGHRELLEEYRKDRLPGKERLSALREKLFGVRYLVLARLAGDDGYENRTIRAETGKNGKALTGRQRVTKGAVRSAVVSFTILDLETRKKVWNGWISRDKRSEVEYIQYDGNPLVTMVASGKAPPDGGVLVVEPDAPLVARDVLVDDAFAVFAASLPTI